MIFWAICANCGKILYLTSDQSEAEKLHFCCEQCERIFWGNRK